MPVKNSMKNPENFKSLFKLVCILMGILIITFCTISCVCMGIIYKITINDRSYGYFYSVFCS